MKTEVEKKKKKKSPDGIDPAKRVRAKNTARMAAKATRSVEHDDTFPVDPKVAAKILVAQLAPTKPTPEVQKLLDKALEVFTFLNVKPRDIQVEGIRKALEHYVNGSRYVVLEGPPGVGKSYIGVAIAHAMGEKSYFATLTAQLQDQYVKDFHGLGMRVLKGRGKFHCERARASCVVGKELYQGKFACAGPENPDECDPAVRDVTAECPYLYAKQAAFNSRLMMANYHSLLANVGYGKSKQKKDVVEDALAKSTGPEQQKVGKPDAGAVVRPFMVLDEAHSIEGHLLDAVGVTVRMKELAGIEPPPLPDSEATDSYPLYVEWLEKTIPIFSARIKAVTDPEERAEMRQLLGKMTFTMKKLGSDTTHSQFIIERGHDEDKDGVLDPTWFAVKPLRVHDYGHWITGLGEKLLLMSATVLNAGMLCENIGLPLSGGDFVQLGCVFPKENRPIRVYPMDQTFKAREEVWPRMAAMVDKLMTHHANEKGLLLVPSNKMLFYIRERLSKVNQLRMTIAVGEEREAKYKFHVQTRMNSVLAASGYWEGADLKGDSSRFQIIPALPRAHFSGQIKARAAIDDRWYDWLTFTKFIQGTGRSVRSESDEAITYLMDKGFAKEMERPSSLIPPWMREAVRVVDMGGPS